MGFVHGAILNADRVFTEAAKIGATGAGGSTGLSRDSLGFHDLILKLNVYFHYP